MRRRFCPDLGQRRTTMNQSTRFESLYLRFASKLKIKLVRDYCVPNSLDDLVDDAVLEGIQRYAAWDAGLRADGKEPISQDSPILFLAIFKCCRRRLSDKLRKYWRRAKIT